MSHWRDTCPLDCKVYVGDLGSGAAKHELERAFSHYGPLRNVWVARNPPGFAFVEFEDPRDAGDSVRALDGRIICGRRVRVELSSGKTRRGRYGRPPPPPRRPYYDDRDRDRDYDKYRRSPRSRSRSPVRRRPRRSRSPRSPRSRSRSGSRGRRSNDRKRSYSRERKSRERSHSPTPEVEDSRNSDGSPDRDVSGDED